MLFGISTGDSAPLERIDDRRDGAKPKILLIVDRPGWAYDNSARQLASRLRNVYDFHFEYSQEPSKIDPGDPSLRSFDLFYQFFWGDERSRYLGIDPERLVKLVSSHRWHDDPAFGPCRTANILVHRYLSDAAAVCCPSIRLLKAISAWHPHVFHVPVGIDQSQFFPMVRREGSLRIGWAGNRNDEVKGLHDILSPACEGQFELHVAGGDLTHLQMNDFYNSIDVIAIASRHEGEPLTLLEGMAAGCFPVCTDVGLVNELVRHGENGLVVKSRSAENFRSAFAWCASNLEHVRRAGRRNAELVHSTRTWDHAIGSFSRLLAETLEHAQRPRFRNDDVSGDSCFESFRQFCELFREFGIHQTHGITLYGRTNTHQVVGDSSDLEGVEYEGYESVSQLPNEQIVALSRDTRFQDRHDLIEFINNSADSVACHGLYHTDHSKMTAAEQASDIAEALSRLRGMFPRKPIKYFIPPFNRLNADTVHVCRTLGLTILATQGVHLEENLRTVTFEPAQWYRYHHHRFYRQSAYRHFDLSLSALRECLERNSRRQRI